MNEQTKATAGSRWIKPIAIFVVLAAVLGAAAPFVGNSLKTNKTEDVLTHTVSRGSLAVSVSEDGTLESSSNIEIKCKVKGGSTVLWVIETGTMVAEGDVLVELDTSQIEDNITQQQIQYETALANRIISNSDVAVAETSITEYLEGTFQRQQTKISSYF